MHSYLRLILGIVMLLVIGCGGSGSKDAIDAAVSADAASDSGSASGDAAPGGGGDAGPDHGDAGAELPDASLGVECGGEICGSGTECCLNGVELSCVEAGTCDGATLVCDGPEDCGEGEVCCGGVGTTCAPVDSCQAVICHTTDDCPDSAQVCCPVGGGGTSMCLNRCVGN